MLLLPLSLRWANAQILAAKATESAEVFEASWRPLKSLGFCRPQMVQALLKLPYSSGRRSLPNLHGLHSSPPNSAKRTPGYFAGDVMKPLKPRTLKPQLKLLQLRVSLNLLDFLGSQDRPSTRGR